MAKNVNKCEGNFNVFEARKKFDKFLVDHKVGKGENYTHTAFGPPWGSYNIPDDELDEFLTLYCNIVGKAELHITEKPKNVGQLLIDIDFHLDDTHEERIYREDDFKYVIGTINGLIRKYYEWDSKALTAYVFEKDTPTEKVHDDYKEYKDGFHIVYPNLPITMEMRYLIISELKKAVTDVRGFRHIPFTNKVNDVFDTSVIKRNGWMMYGSRKHDGKPYYLTHIIKCTFDEMDVKRLNIKDIVKLVCNRKYNDDDVLPYKDSVDMDQLQSDIDEVLQSYNVKNDTGKKKKDTKPAKNDFKNKNDEIFDDDCDDLDEEDHEEKYSNNKDDETRKIKNEILKSIKEEHKKKKADDDLKELEMAKKLVMMMSKDRATSYDEWVRVGWALHGTNENLLNVYKLFSKKAGKTYNEKSCEKVWENAKDKGYCMGSLRHWAKMDNPEKYSDLLTESINGVIVEAENGTEYDVAKVVYEVYKEIYKCTSIKHSTWYEFQGHRWVEVEGGYTLSKKISEDITKQFALLSSTYMLQMNRAEGTDSDTLLKRSNNIMKLMLNLKRHGFKQRVIEECMPMFRDTTFEEKLDSNRNLIGFSNGVYDLEMSKFRPGIPDDFISLSVGYDWKEYSMTHPAIVGIKDYFCKVQPEKDMREYILTLMSSYLDGHTKKEQFVLWTGSGCHAAGTNIRMFDGTLKKVEDITIGDKLMGDDFKPRLVKNLYRGNDDMYHVNQTNGITYTVNGPHRLALKFNGETEVTFNEKKQRYEIVWYEYNDVTGIIRRKNFFKLHEEVLAFRDTLKDNENRIPFDHTCVMTVKGYLALPSNIKPLLLGYKAEYVSETETKCIRYPISFEYAGKDEYYGFETSDNQRYLLEDYTVTCNSNGKSKTVELFQLAFGDYCGVLPVTLLTGKRTSSGQATPELALMRGKRFVVFQEPENNDEIKVGFMKELTGGDWIYARPLFKDPIRFKPQFKLLLTCNKLPHIPSTDGGTWRRLRVSPFESEFVDEPKLAHQFKKDYDLLEKLESWSKAFLWFLLKAYYPIYRKDGLTEPNKVTQFTNKYKKQSDLFFEFIDSNLECTKQDKDFETFEVIYTAFRYWYSESYSMKPPFAKKDLVEYLSNNNYKIDKNHLFHYKFAGTGDKNDDNDLDG